MPWRLEANGIDELAVGISVAEAVVVATVSILVLGLASWRLLSARRSRAAMALARSTLAAIVVGGDLSPAESSGLGSLPRGCRSAYLPTSVSASAEPRVDAWSTSPLTLAWSPELSSGAVGDGGGSGYAALES